MGRCAFIIVIIFNLIVCVANGQSIEDLCKKREKAAQSIRKTSKLLAQTSKSTRTSLNKLAIYNKNIQSRKSLIEGINGQISLLNEVIGENEEVIDLMREDLKLMRKEYANMIRHAQRSNVTYDAILFVLSADNLNQAYKRLLYMKQYVSIRKKQVETIDALKQLMEIKVADLQKRKDEKAELLGEKEAERVKLEQEQKKQLVTVAQLKKKQRELKKILAEQRKVELKLQREIEKLIAEAERKARKGKGFELTPEQKLISDNFVQNKGRLPWPVESGIVVDKFGEHAHAVLKNIKVKNNGVDIATNPHANVRAVFKGEVSRVVLIPGGNMAVIIRHGEFLSVYSNLENVIVKMGDHVDTKQKIGSVFTDKTDEQKAVLKFQVWKGSQKMNPEFWIAK
ncbi:hypothetical protein EYV94_17340 [Puteibacter caeruleilacunae]|nr:hypothetical protein EYV94_17340 [Puteibacter caeruleilacunae]